MSSLKINGGKSLHGLVRLGGAKNASYKLMIASLLAKGESRLLNFSHIEDVSITRKIIESLGGKTSTAGERTVFIDALELKKYSIPDEFGPQSRASTMFIPVLLHLFGKASVPMPGGDQIGQRPLDRHFDGLKAMGARIEQTNDRVNVFAEKLKGTNYRFEKNTHTGTETLVMAAVLAQGTTLLENVALEPEVDDLIEFLNEMGAWIRRKPGKVIEIKGVRKLEPAIHKIIPDRNEAVSYACAAIITKGDIIVENAQAQHIDSFLEKLDEIGAGYEVGNYGVRFFYKGKLKATSIETKPHPGFMTDWQPLWTVLATQCKGKSLIHEAIHSNRFQHAEGLKQFGARIEYAQVEVSNPEKVYNFDLENDQNPSRHAIEVTGPTVFKPTELDVYDLRSGATFVLAALACEGTSILHKVELIDRGYESFDERLRSMGADITRIE